MLKIIITGLIAYFPVYKDLNVADATKSQVLAVLIADADHAPMLHTVCKSGGFDGSSGEPNCTMHTPLPKGDISVQGHDLTGTKSWKLDSSGLYKPSTGWTTLIEMTRMRLQGQDDPGEPDLTKIALGSTEVAARLRLTKGSISVRPARLPEYKMLDKDGKLVRHYTRRIGEVVEYSVPIPGGMDPVILVGGTEYKVTAKVGSDYYAFITNTPKADWKKICQTNQLAHAMAGYKLSKNPGSAIPWTAEGPNELDCYFCETPGKTVCQGETGSPGGGPVRCPAMLFNPIASVP